MKRLLVLLFAISLMIVTLTSCEERSYIMFDDASATCDAKAQTVILSTTKPVEFITIHSNQADELDCQLQPGDILECDGGWFIVSCRKNDFDIKVSLRANDWGVDRSISIQALSNGTYASCTLVQTKD